MQHIRQIFKVFFYGSLLVLDLFPLVISRYSKCQLAAVNRPWLSASAFYFLVTRSPTVRKGERDGFRIRRRLMLFSDAFYDSTIGQLDI